MKFLDNNSADRAESIAESLLGLDYFSLTERLEQLRETEPELHLEVLAIRRRMFSGEIER